jgi:peptidyl-prolyl cis-trans isomerase D
MLDIFRKRGLSSVVYGVIIIATILVFVIQFRPNAGQQTASLKEACVVLVKGHCINPKSYKASYRLLIPRDQSGNLLTARARQMGLGKITADGLVERELLVSEADRIGVRATPDEVDNEILSGFIHVSVPSDNPYLASSLRIQDGKIYAGFKDPKSKQFDYKVYERSIRMLTGKSATEFKEEQERELVAAKMRDMVRAPIRVSDAEALEMYLAEKSSARVAYVPIELKWVGRWAVPAKQSEIDNWLKDKANAALVEATVAQRKGESAPAKDHIRHILIKVEPSAKDEDKALALGRIAYAAARVKGGEAFADVAREMSEDTGSAMKGGDVGDKTDGFVKPFKDAADALKAGEVTSEAIQTQFGYHLIVRDDPAKAGEVEAQLKRDATREQFVKSKALDIAKEIAAKVQAEMKAGKSAEDTAKAVIAQYAKLTVPSATIGVKAIETAPKPEAADAGAAEAGASADAGKKGQSPKPAGLAAKAPTADTDPDRPRAETSSSFNKGGDPIPALGSDASGQVTKFAFGSRDGDVMPEPLRSDDGFVVVALKEHKSATKEDFDKERDTYTQTLLAAKQAEALALYVKRLRESAKADVKIDETFTREQTKDGGVPLDLEEDEGQ